MRMFEERVFRIGNRIVDVCFFVLLIVIFGVKIRYLFHLVSLPIAIVGAGFIAGLFGLLYLKRKSLAGFMNIMMEWAGKLTFKQCIWIISCISIITKLAAIFIFQINIIDVHPDVKAYVATAYELTHGGRVVTTANYCYDVPYTFRFALILAPVVKIFGWSQMALSIYLTMLLTIATILAFDLFNNLLGRQEGFWSVLIYSLLPGTILLPSFVIHENGLIFFGILSLWLYFRVYRNMESGIKKAGSFLLFAIALSYTMLINGGGYILAIALLIYIFMKDLLVERQGVQTVCQVLGIILVTLFIGKVLGDFQISVSDITESHRKNAVVWSMYVGANEETQGGWSYEDAKFFENYDENWPEEKISAYERKLMMDRWKDLLGRPGDLGKHMLNKLEKQWGVQAYTIGYVNELIPNKYVAWFYKKILFRLFLPGTFLIELLLLGWGILSILRDENEKQFSIVQVLKMYLIGMTLLFLITEVTVKYTISFQLPFITIMIYYGISKSDEQQETMKRKE